MLSETRGFRSIYFSRLFMCVIGSSRWKKTCCGSETLERDIARLFLSN